MLKNYLKKPETTKPDDVDLSQISICALICNKKDEDILANIFSDLSIKIIFCDNTDSLNETIKNSDVNLVIIHSEIFKESSINLNEIKNINPNFPVAIAFIEENYNIETKIIAHKEGVDFFIRKPFEYDTLICQIYHLLKIQLEFSTFNLKRQNFIAALTHDLKNPVNAEISALEMLVQNRFGQINQDQRIIIESILNSSKYMKHITDQILCFYKYNNNSILLNKEEIILDKVIYDAIDSIKFITNDKKQHIIINNDIKGQKVFADEIELKRVIHNLITNAAEYSQENADIIINLLSDKKEFTVEVIDFGCGIKTENMHNIFDEYMSLAKTQKKVGFGLGLNICKQIIKAHGGDISIKSVQNKGTTVKFTIPR